MYIYIYIYREREIDVYISCTAAFGPDGIGARPTGRKIRTHSKFDDLVYSLV